METSPDKLVYEGRIRSFDPEPGEVIYLVDDPDGDGQRHGPCLASEIEKWFGAIFVSPEHGRVRITVEKLPTTDEWPYPDEDPPDPL